jgi:hypothetical protein
MKAILEYTMPEEQLELGYALKGIDSLLVIEDLFNEIRSAVKYESGAFAGLDIATLDKIREWVHEQKAERNIPELV